MSADGISMDPAKVQVVMNWPIPESCTALQRFLQFANFLLTFHPKCTTEPILITPDPKDQFNLNCFRALAVRSSHVHSLSECNYPVSSGKVASVTRGGLPFDS